MGGAREVFLYDQRGCGKSAKATSYDLKLYVNELKRVAQELGVGGDGGGAHVVAHGYWRATGDGARARRGDSSRRSRSCPRRCRARTRFAIGDERSTRCPRPRETPRSSTRKIWTRRGETRRGAVREFSERFVSRRGRTGACFTDALAPKSSDAQRRAITGGRYFTLGGSLADDAIDVDGLGDRLRRNGVRSRASFAAPKTPRARRPFVKSSTR